MKTTTDTRMAIEDITIFDILDAAPDTRTDEQKADKRTTAERLEDDGYTCGTY